MRLHTMLKHCKLHVHIRVIVIDDVVVAVLRCSANTQNAMHALIYIIYRANFRPNFAKGLHHFWPIMADTIADWLVVKVESIIGDGLRTGAIVSAWEEVKELLKANNLAWVQQVPPEHVGTHRQNRSGEGVGAIQAHSHGNDICQQGWSWQKASDAVAVEYINGDSESDTFNTMLVELSDGMLPPLASLKLLTISASHTNAFLRSVKAQTKSGCPQLADARGMLNLDTICLNRSGLREAITHGLKWLVLSNKCVEKFPRLIDMCQKSMNTHARETQSEIEVMLSMLQQAQVPNPDWQAIETAAKFPNPPCKKWIPALAEYVRQHGGAGLLEDINLFSRTIGGNKDQAAAGSKKMLGSEFWSKLNAVNWGGGKKMPYTMASTIKANLASPPHKVVDGFCKLVESRHIGTLSVSGNRKMVEQAEALMTDMRAVVAHLSMSPSQRARVLGKLDVRCVCHVLKLGKVAEGVEFKSIDDIAQARCMCAYSRREILITLSRFCNCVTCHPVNRSPVIAMCTAYSATALNEGIPHNSCTHVVMFSMNRTRSAAALLSHVGSLHVVIDSMNVYRLPPMTSRLK